LFFPLHPLKLRTHCRERGFGLFGCVERSVYICGVVGFEPELFVAEPAEF